MKRILLLLLMLAWYAGYAQNRYSGVVRDAVTLKPLPFATVVVSQNRTRGVTTNLHGEFTIAATGAEQQLIVSYMGYEPRSVATSTLKASGNEVLLTPSVYNIDEVTVYPTENPAHRIINNAIAHIKDNNPDENPSYRCRIYSKTTLRIEPLPNSKHESKFRSFADTMNMLVTESVADRMYAYKDITQEKVIANRVSGFKNPQFCFNTTSFQPIHFYSTNISLLDKNFLNPISPNSTKSYFFLIQDTLVVGADTTFVIQFTPRRNTNFDGLKGFVHINSNGWAIQNVVAERAEKAGIDIKIEQQYTRQRGKWFPSQYRHKVTLNNYPPGMGLCSYMEGVGTVYDVSIAGAAPKSLTRSTVAIADTANNAYSAIERYRPSPLTKKDSTTYKSFERLTKNYDLDQFQFLFENLLQLKIPFGMLSMPFTALYSSNRYESNRFGLALETNRRLTKYASLGGYFAYGTRDAEWKYGGSVTLFPKGDPKTSLKLSYRNDVDMATHFYLVGERRNALVNRFLLDKADRIIEYAAKASTRIWDIDLSLGGKLMQLAPTYSYRYKGVEQQHLWTNSAEVDLTVRLGYKERETKFFNSYIYETQGYPVIGVNIRQGLSAMGGDYRYTSVEAGIFKRFTIRKAGVLRLTALAGNQEGDVPYSFLYDTNGTNSSYFPFLVNNSFNCAKPFEYASSRYGSLFAYYDLGSLLYATKKFKPTVSIFQAAGWSRLANSARYEGLGIKDMRDGYFESGLILGSIIRYKVFGFLYLGFGAGAFVAYGDAVKQPLDKTITYKASIDVDF
jgi:hypothetical protein